MNTVFYQPNASNAGFSLIREPDHAHDPAKNALSGFWLFMMSDLIIFGLFFATYITMLTPMAFAGGPTPKGVLEISGAALETTALLASTFTFAMADAAIKFDRSLGEVLAWLGATFGFGLLFLVLEAKEFAHLINSGAAPERSGYLSAFFGLVPLHGMHVAVGVVWLGIMMLQVSKQGVTEAARSRLARLALFWHFLDLIWIGIFSVVYLGGLS